MAESSTKQAFSPDTLHGDIAAEDYRAADGVNASKLKDILISPGHCKYFAETPKTPTPAMTLGTLVHLAVLEPHLMAQATPDESGRKGHMFVPTSEGQATDLQLRVTKDAHAKAAEIAQAVQKNAVAQKILANGKPEQSIWWHDATHGLQCKARLDLVTQGANGKRIGVDLKTIDELVPGSFSRASEARRYDLQAAHYVAAGDDTGLYSGEHFLFIVVETKAPFSCMVYSADAEFLATGHQWREYAMRSYARAHASGDWAFPSSDVLRLPPWAKTPQDLIDKGQLADI